MMEELVNATNVIEAQQEMAEHNAGNEAAAEIALEEVVVVTGEAEEIPAVDADANTATQA